MFCTTSALKEPSIMCYTDELGFANAAAMTVAMVSTDSSSARTARLRNASEIRR